MIYEVEQKYRVHDLADIVRQLQTRGVAWMPEVQQVDRYFDHPAKQFGETDEALRLRSVGAQNRITYKGPKIDPTTKTRREIELPLTDGSETVLGFSDLLLALGFRPSLEVRKQRRLGKLAWEGETVEIALDEVQGLGSFVELELTAGPDRVERARERIVSLAASLGLETAERRSYLEMLLEKHHAT